MDRSPYPQIWRLVKGKPKFRSLAYQATVCLAAHTHTLNVTSLVAACYTLNGKSTIDTNDEALASRVNEVLGSEDETTMKSSKSKL